MIYIFAIGIYSDIMEIEEEVIQVMKKKAERFNQDEGLAHYAMQRQLGKWVIEGEKKLKYEEGIQQGIKEGKVGEKLKDVRTVIQRLYKTNNSDWLDNCSYEQLDIIFDQALMNTPLSQIQQNINQNNV